jgi:hypothetical protein
MWEMLIHRDQIKNFTGGGRDGVGGSGVVFKHVPSERYLALKYSNNFDTYVPLPNQATFTFLLSSCAPLWSGASSYNVALRLL